jgi:arginase family enzyme
MERLSKITDIIYVHIDMDVLDPAEVPGHSLTVPGGPTSTELAKAIELMFSFPKSSAIGIASLPMEDPGDHSLEAAYKLIEAAVRGVQKR